jgi:hypothetical protein
MRPARPALARPGSEAPDLRDLADALNDVERFSSESATRGSYIPGLGTDTGWGTGVRAPSLAFLQ